MTVDCSLQLGDCEARVVTFKPDASDEPTENGVASLKNFRVQKLMQALDESVHFLLANLYCNSGIEATFILGA